MNWMIQKSNYQIKCHLLYKKVVNQMNNNNNNNYLYLDKIQQGNKKMKKIKCIYKSNKIKIYL